LKYYYIEVASVYEQHNYTVVNANTSYITDKAIINILL